MYYIGVIGAASCSSEMYIYAEKVGREIARRGAVLICGGRSGIMEAAAKGANSQGGTVIGILPGRDRKEANPYLTYSIVTNMGDARNAIIARSSDAIIALDGGCGTLSEIGLSLKAGIPVIGLNSWKITGKDGENIFPEAKTPKKAVEMALTLARKGC